MSMKSSARNAQNVAGSARRLAIQEHNKKKLQEWLGKRTNKTEFEEKALADSYKSGGRILQLIFIGIVLALVGYFMYGAFVKEDETFLFFILLCIPLVPLAVVLMSPLWGLPQKNWYRFTYKVSTYLKTKGYNSQPSDIDFEGTFLNLANSDKDFEREWNDCPIPGYLATQMQSFVTGLITIVVIFGIAFFGALISEGESPKEFFQEIKKDIEDTQKYGHERSDLDEKIYGDGYTQAEILEKIEESKDGQIYLYYYEEEGEYATQALFLYCTEDDTLPAAIMTKKEDDWYFISYELPVTSQYLDVETIRKLGQPL